MAKRVLTPEHIERLRENGRNGGLATRDRYGPEHFRAIGGASQFGREQHPRDQAARRVAGSKGGATTRERHGREHYQRIGRLGGAARRAQLGPGGYTALGQKGGATVAARYGHAHFVAAGHKGGTNRWRAQRVAATLEETTVEQHATETTD